MIFAMIVDCQLDSGLQRIPVTVCTIGPYSVVNHCLHCPDMLSHNSIWATDNPSPQNRWNLDGWDGWDGIDEGLVG